MAHSPDQIKADKAAIDSGHCPECNADLNVVDPASHARLCLPHGMDSDKKDTDHARRHRLVAGFKPAKAVKE